MALLPICERLQAMMAQGWVLSAHATVCPKVASPMQQQQMLSSYQLQSVGNDEYTACAADGTYSLRLWVRRLRGQQRYLLLAFESDGNGARLKETKIKTRRLPATETTARALRDSVLAVVYGVLSGSTEEYTAQHGLRATYAGAHLAVSMQRYMAGERVTSSKKDPDMKDLLELALPCRREATQREATQREATQREATQREATNRKRKDRA